MESDVNSLPWFSTSSLALFAIDADFGAARLLTPGWTGWVGEDGDAAGDGAGVGVIAGVGVGAGDGTGAGAGVGVGAAGVLG